MSAPCIICNSTSNKETVEHIIPQSLGNEYYVLPKGAICFNCNNRIAKVEYRVVSSALFIDQRKEYGLISPKNDNSITELNNDDLIYLLVKMGYEGLYHSRKKIWTKYNWSDVRAYLLHSDKGSISFDRSQPPVVKFKSIPKWMDRFRLKNHHLSLDYALEDNKVFVRFQFGKIQVWTRMK